MLKLKILLDYLFSTGVIAAPFVGVGYLYADQKNISWKDIIAFLKKQELIKEDDPDKEDVAIPDVPALPPLPSVDDSSTEEEDSAEEVVEEKSNDEGSAPPPVEEKKNNAKPKKKKPEVINKEKIMKIIEELIKNWEEKENKEDDKEKKDKFKKGVCAFKVIKNMLDTSYEDDVAPSSPTTTAPASTTDK